MGEEEIAFPCLCARNCVSHQTRRARFQFSLNQVGLELCVHLTEGDTEAQSGCARLLSGSAELCTCGRVSPGAPNPGRGRPRAVHPTRPTPHLAKATCSSSSLRPSWARSSSARCCCSTICSCSSEPSTSSRRFSFSSSWRLFSSFRRRSGGGRWGGGACTREPDPQTQGDPRPRSQAELSVSFHPSRSFPASPSLGSPTGPQTPRCLLPSAPQGQPLLLLAGSLCPALSSLPPRPPPVLSPFCFCF